MLPYSSCGGKRQSPVNIEKQSVVVDKHLESFTFTKFDDKHAIEYITNTGHAGPALIWRPCIDFESVC